jgi:serine/threonine protein kinase
MKSFSKSFESFFDNEVFNLWTLGDSDAQGVVQYLGSFRHASWPAHPHAHAHATSPAERFTEIDGDTTSYHILMEYGTGDLHDLFEEAPPSHHTEIRCFWADLFRVAKALEELHELQITVEGTSTTVVAYAQLHPYSDKPLTKIGSMVISSQRI